MKVAKLDTFLVTFLLDYMLEEEKWSTEFILCHFTKFKGQQTREMALKVYILRNMNNLVYLGKSAQHILKLSGIHWRNINGFIYSLWTFGIHASRRNINLLDWFPVTILLAYMLEEEKVISEHVLYSFSKFEVQRTNEINRRNYMLRDMTRSLWRKLHEAYWNCRESI